MSELLAAYGTLMRGERGPSLAGVEDALEFVATCRIRGQLFDAGAYPVMVEGEGEVVGELFRVRDATTWEKLDAYEGTYYTSEQESLFVRRVVRLIEPEIDAWVYFFNRAPKGPKIARWK